MKRIIDTDKLEKLPKYAWSDVGAVPCNRGDYIHIDDFRKFIANSPQADGMVLVPSEQDNDWFEIIASNNTKHRYSKKTHFWQFALVQGSIDELDKTTVEVMKLLPDDDFELEVTFPNIVRVGDVGLDDTLSLPEKQLCRCPKCGYAELSAYKPQAVVSGQGLVIEMPQADDVRKDAEPSDDKLKAMRDFAMSVQLSHDYDWIDYMRDMYFIAINKARE